MRKLIIGAAVLAAALATAAVAIAAQTTVRTFTQNFASSATGTTTKKPHTITGSYFKETSHDPSNTDNNQQPKLDSYVEDILPRGAKIDQAIPKSCSATADDFAAKGNNACSKKSRVGTGHAKVRLKFNGSGDIPADISAYNNKKKKSLILYVNPHGSNPIVLLAKVQGKPGKVQKLHVPIPINCVLGAPPDCKHNGSTAGDARIVSFELGLARVHKKVRKSKHSKKKVNRGFVTTPPKCPSSKKWTFTIKFHGRDGVDQIKKSDTPCK